MQHEIQKILDADSRLWNQREWFLYTIGFLCDEIEHCVINTSIAPVASTPHNLIERLSQVIDETTAKNKKLSDKIRIILILFNTNQFILAQEHIEELTSSLKIKDVDLQGLLSVLLGEISIEKMEYRKANEYFLRGLLILHATLTPIELMDYFLRWTSLFIESSDFDYAERLLNNISQKVTPIHTYLYTNMLYMLFSLKKRMLQPEPTITYANLLNSCDPRHLQNDQWYNLHLFCGDHFSNIDTTFEKTIYHYTQANTYLTNKWKEYIQKISELNQILSPAEYIKIRAKYEEKQYIIILENSMHNNHFITSLKTAYVKLQDANNTLKEHTYLDSLTGLYNRRFLWERSTEFIQRAWSRNVPISCFMIDIDYFKGINDTFGHLECDKVLKCICECIKTFFRKTDIVIRFGGDEILAMMYNLNSENALIKGEKLRKTIEEMCFTTANNEVIKATVSIGISSAESVGDEPARPAKESDIINRLIEEADKHLYVAKTEGRNRVSS